MATHRDHQEILDFWFGQSPSYAERIAQKSSLWWGKDPAVDGEIESRFGECLQAAIAGLLDDWKQNPEGLLALIIVLDQFSRNIHHDFARAFAQDALALSLCLEGIEKGIDMKLDLLQRVFFYLPLEHAESMALQRRSVEMQKQLAESAPEDVKDNFRGFHKYALLHMEVIDRYGRYPHRNVLLGRASTAEEIEYLNNPEAGF